MDTAASRRSVANPSTSSSNPLTASYSAIGCNPIVVTLHVLASALAMTLPLHGTVVPGKSLGGVRVGASPAKVRTAWGRAFGVCTDCKERTWYFTYARYAPQGAGVEFRRKRVAALFTLWSPSGWHTAEGLRIGDDAARVTAVYGPLTRLDCGTYDAYQLPRGRFATDFYAFDGKVWGFAVTLTGVPACR